MAAAIDALKPEWVVIENVRGLLSSPATRPPTEGDDHEQRNPGDAAPDSATGSGRRYVDLGVMLTGSVSAQAGQG